MEFTIDAGFFESVIEGDNKTVMTSISFTGSNLSWIGHVVHDIQCLAHGLHWVQFSYVNRGANSMAHSLARFARNVFGDITG